MKNSHIGSCIVKNKKILYKNTNIRQQVAGIEYSKNELIKVDHFDVEVQRTDGTITEIIVTCNCGKSVILGFSCLSE